MSVQAFQLIILPKGDINTPTGVYVYCPFTRILTEGDTYEEAVEEWASVAKSEFGTNFIIPRKDELLRRKVWYGVLPDTEFPVFYIDFARNISEKPSLVIPSSHTIMEADAYSADLGVLFDWQVPCSRILHAQENINFQWHSLTPNVIN
jgi:hypothetical protein